MVVIIVDNYISAGI